MPRYVSRFLAALGVLAVVPAAAVAQGGGGTIAGRVTDSTSSQPVPNAQVQVVGTTLGTLSREDGSYRISGVPAGQVQVRALRIGYGAATQSATVPAGGTVTLDFALAQQATILNEQIVTATGERQLRRETGASVAKVSVDSIPLAATPNFSDVLSSRVAGVTVQSSGGTTGTGSRVRIRGSNSVSLSNDPLIIIDGIRVNNSANSSTIGVGGQLPSRFNDIDPDQIESIEIIKGPAAAALYGTAASNGVIQITTKRGTAGQTRWQAFVEGGSIQDVTQYPTNYRQIGFTNDDSSRTANCFSAYQALGVCTPYADSLVTSNPLEDFSPFMTGWREQVGLNVSGGGSSATYFVAGDYEREQGVYDPNKLRRANIRANIGARPSEKLRLQVNAGYLTSRLALPQNDNNSAGIVSGGLLGLPPEVSPYYQASNGYYFVSPQKLFQLDTRQNVERFTGSMTANWTPLSWLSAVATGGLDYTDRYDQFFIAPNVFTDNEDPDLAQGQRASNPFQTFVYNFNGSATARYGIMGSVRGNTTLGTQYVREYTHGTEAFGQAITPGTSSLGGATALFEVDEASSDIITIGAYGQQEVQFGNRLFLTAGLRTDNNSAFGVNTGFVYYPSAGISWVVSEEPFFPDNNIVSALRLRAAWGKAGQRPNFRDAVDYFTPVAVAANETDVPGITVGGTGNVSLKPEVSTEYETGVEAGLFNDRAQFQLTYYNKTTRDALVSQRLAASLGVSETRFINLGEVKNTGVEGLLSATLLDTRPVRADVSVTGATTNNKLVNLGEGIKPIIFGLGTNTQRFQNGYPLGGYWQQPIESFSDADGNGIITPDEVQIGDTAVYLGSPFPRRELTITPRVTLFKYVQVSGLFDYRGGFKLYNGTEDFRCGVFLSCRAIQDPSAPLADQARAVANAFYGTVAGYIEDASFWKLREVAVTIGAPTTWAGRLGLGGVSLTLAGRNLKTWTDYTGFDPELNFAAQANYSQADFLTQPPVRYYTARLNITW